MPSAAYSAPAFSAFHSSIATANGGSANGRNSSANVGLYL